MTVDPYLAVHIHPVEIDKNKLVLIRCRQGERLPVPADAPGKRAPAHPCGILWAEGTFYAPVMGQVEQPPSVIDVAPFPGLYHIPQVKPPSRVKGHPSGSIFAPALR